MNEKAVLNKTPNFKKLIEYGFERREGYYIFAADIIDGMFCYNIYVTNSGETELEVIDKETNEEYTLVAADNAVGSFVARVRLECEDILNGVLAECYEPNVFKTEYSRLIIGYMRSKYNIEAEYLWEKSPNNAIFREVKTKKWYAVLMTIEKRKLGIYSDGIIEVINLKETPENVTKLVDGKNYFTGFHMNKKHWYTVCLDKSVPIEKIYECIDKSYELIKGRK